MHRKMLSQVNRVGASRPAPGPARVPDKNGPSISPSPSHPFWTGSRPRRKSGAKEEVRSTKEELSCACNFSTLQPFNF